MRGSEGIYRQSPKLHKELRALIVLACLLAPVGALVIAMRSSSSAQSAIPAAESAEAELDPPAFTPPAKEDAKSEAMIDFQSSQPSQSQSPTTSLRVNNQPVQVPDNGSTHQVMTDSNGTTTIDISNSSTTTNGSSSSSMDVEINTDSTVTSENDSGP
jgi:hypothetical protein